MEDKNVINAYSYGSRVYGNFSKHSDYDFIFVVKNRTNEQYSDNLININFYTEEGHKQRIEEHEISALECLFLDKVHILKETIKIPFKLNISKLRHSLSKKSSNSWVKCKKKLTVKEDYDMNLGRKSMFHSFRIIDYGIQITKNGRIEKYDSCNELFTEIFLYYDWDNLYNTFKPRYNQLLTNFRTLTHK